MDESVDATPTQQKSVLPDVFAGVGIGVLLGTMVSLSITPVVAGVVGALTSLLAVFLGLDGSSSGGRVLKVNALRIGSFGFATVIGLGLGLYLRANEPLKIPPAQLHASWQAAFPDNAALARQMTLYEYSGIKPAQWQFDPQGTGSEASIDPDMAKRVSSVLYSTLSEYDACNRLDPEDWGKPDKLIAQYGDPAAPDLVQALGKNLVNLPDNLPDPDKTRLLAKAHEYVCLIQDAGA